MTCAVCLHLRPVRPRKAVTVAYGHAVCEHHLAFVVAYPALDEAVTAARGNEGLL